MLDRRVQPVLAAIESYRIVAARLAGIVERANVAARAERLFTHAGDDDALDRRIARPCVQLRVHEIDHAERQRVQRLWPVERDDARPSPDLE